MALGIEQLTDTVKNQGEPLIDLGSLSLPEPKYIGKVRNTYQAGKNVLLIVATDKISTFDNVHPDGVAGKGVILTQMSLNWLPIINRIPNHLISANQNDFPEPFRSQPELAHRSMLVEELQMLPAEHIVRGNITGSAWKEYTENGTVLGHTFTQPLVESQFLPNNLFTPSTKEATGHDQNITYEQMVDLFIKKYGIIQGKELAEKSALKSMTAFERAVLYAHARGIIIADTKFEFGLNKKGELLLADEVLTPDSSRIWAREIFKPGQPQPSFDKQYVRDWATSTGWDKNPPAPRIPFEVAQITQDKYLEAYSRLFA